MPKKYLLAALPAILSLGLLSACNDPDDNEPDPSEEPSEQQQQSDEEVEEESE